MAGVCGFWQPKRQGTRAPVDMASRCRPKGMRTSAVLRPPGITVNFEVETFKIFGKLRKTETEVHNSLPTLETIQTEKSLLSFEEKRRQSPDNADYGHFYRSLMSSITPAPSSRAPSAITFGRRANVTRGDDSRYGLSTRQSSTFSLGSRGTDSRLSLDSRSATRSSMRTGPLGQDFRANGPKRGDSASARSLIHIHDVAADQRRNSKQLDVKMLEHRRKSRHEEVDSLLMDFINKQSGQ